MTTAGDELRRHLAARSARGDLYAPECPSRSVLDHVTSRWGVLVLVLLLDRPYRFSELAGAIGGVSDKMLSQTLKLLVADGLVRRTVNDEGPVRVTYAVTDSGGEAASRLAELVDWIEANTSRIVATSAP